MAQNAAEIYGHDVRCVLDADELFSSANGIDVVRQDALHRLTTDHILGDDGTGSLVIENWGYDVRRLLGAPSQELQRRQPFIAGVLVRDPRIQFADVQLRSVRTNGMDDVEIRVTCTTALGPFSLVFSVLDLTPDRLVGQ